MKQGDLLTELLDRCPELDPDCFTPLGSGAEAHVYRGRLRDGRAVAVKVARAATLSSGNDPSQDTSALLRQEANLARHAVAHGVPAPEPIAGSKSGDDLVFLVSEFIDVDQTAPSPRDVGQALGRIHAVPLPKFDLVCMDGCRDIDEVLLERVPARLARLRGMYGVPVEQAPIAEALALPTPPMHRSLLHMDYRRANWLVSRGSLRAVVDWSNALVGDPSLDLARSTETGAIDKRVISEYDGPADVSERSSHPRHLVYRLDAAVMLAHVFLSAGESTAAQHYVGRCMHLCTNLRSTLK
jgi:Ser/Thr protein kinase RdoA (MazF antagonist)